MWMTQRAEQTGRGHQMTGVPCQDKTMTMCRNGVIAMALADGAGSARLSHEGAACAVEAVCEVLCRKFEELSTTSSPLDMRLCVLGAVSERMLQRAEELEVPVSELACTLLAVAVRENRYLIFHVGDGVIGYRKNDKLMVASGPENGEFSNTTVFVTSKNALLKSKVMRGEQAALEGFILMSDGCETVLYHKRSRRLAPFLNRLLQRAELLEREVSEEMLRAVLAGVISRRTIDDCSLTVMVREGAQSGGWDKLTHREKAAILGIATEKRSRRRRQIRKYERQCVASAAIPTYSPDEKIIK